MRVAVLAPWAGPLALILAGLPRLASAAEVEAVLPGSAQVQAALAASPAVAAAQHRLQAERAAARQLGIGAQEWTLSTSATRRRPTAGANEWDLGLDRPVRLPGKAAAAERLGASRVATAEAALRQSWREQARLLLERYASWQRERAAARVAGEQVAVAAEQAQAVGRRQRLGDAARMEALQADAALSQSQALQATAQARADAAQAALQAQFQGAWQPGEKAPHLPPPQPPPATPADALRVWLDASAELAVARLEARSAAAQRDVEMLDRRPDPTLGVRVGRALGGAEQVLMFTASLPFGGAYRQAGVDATAERAAQMEALALDLERRLAIEAQARLRELQTTYTGWQRSAMAARQFEQSAAGLARSYQLGEGSLGEVLAARRLANEQRQAEALAAVDAWLAVWRTALESGQLWPAPNEPGAAAGVAPGG